jgi:hypothetical protein
MFSQEQLDAGLKVIRESSRDFGVVEMIVRCPDIETREVLEECKLDSVEGLVGDNWLTRGSSRTSDGLSHSDMQLTLMNSGVTHLIAQARERWCLAGDQLFIDMDLSTANLPPGTQIQLAPAEDCRLPADGADRWCRHRVCRHDRRGGLRRQLCHGL